jgi:hypothetical protein
MQTLKRFLGIVWIALALAAGWYLLVNQALPKFQSAQPEDKIPALIYSCILMPLITGGLGLFGYYALKGEYSSIKNKD